mgnify:CR=1 FL=1
MVDLSNGRLRELMDKPENIRHLTIIAHVDHGRSTLTDLLVRQAGIKIDNGGSKSTGTTEDQKDTSIIIRSTTCPLYYEYDPYGKGKSDSYLINLVDFAPGMVDFSPEFMNTFHMTDGALVLVDCIEGVCIQTETLLRQAMMDMVSPVLMLNKIDRLIFELQLETEDMYQMFVKHIDSVNAIVSAYEQPAMGDTSICPTRGNVAFGSGLRGWAFTITTFARIYSKKFNIDQEKLMKKLWGDNYYDNKSKKWLQEPVNEERESLKRAFCAFIMEPVAKLSRSIMEGNIEQMEKMLTSLEISLTPKEKELTGRPLLQLVMSKWISAADTVLEMMVLHLPSPQAAQKYRVGRLYNGPQDDEIAVSFRDCNPKGPLILYVSKMVPTTDKGRFLAFGRVFGGTVSEGQTVRIMGPNYTVGKKVDLFVKSIQKTVIMRGRTVDYVSDVPCGNLVGLVGVDQFLVKEGTISDNENSHTIRTLKHTTEPPIKYVIEPKNPADLPKLVEGLKKLAKYSTDVKISVEENGQHVASGSQLLRLEIDLKDYVDCEVVISPLIAYKETVTAKSSQICMAKSANKHNRLYVTAEPLAEELVKFIETDDVVMNPSNRNTWEKILCDDFAWDQAEAKKVWSFGPEERGANILVDATTGVQFMDEIKDSMVAAFQWVTKEGVMIEEGTRSIRMNIVDAALHADAIHRGGGQIIPTTRRVCYAAELTAEPRILEPFYWVEITAPGAAVSGVYQTISMKRGTIVEEEPVVGSPLTKIKAYIPATESFRKNSHGFPSYLTIYLDFATALRANTSGQAFPQFKFSHWNLIPDDPFEADSRSGLIVAEYRKRKGLKEGIPALDNYIDKP